MRKPITKGIKNIIESVFKYDVVKDSIGSIQEKIITKIDKQGRIIKTSKQDSNEYDEFETSIYKYDNQDRKIEKLKYDIYDSLIVKTIYEYDVKGYLVNKYFVDSKGNPCNYPELNITKEIYKYDSKGKLIEEKYFDINGKVDFHYEYIYDSDEKLIIKSDLINRWETKTIYDTEGNIIEEKDLDEDGLLMNNYFYKYNNEGTLLYDKIVSNVDDYFFKKESFFKYDSKNRIKEIKNINQMSKRKFDQISLYEYNVY